MISSVKDSSEAVVISFHNDLNFETCQLLEGKMKELTEVLKPANKVIIELKDVEFIDSSGISLLIKWLYPIREKELITRNTSENIKGLFEICKMDQFLKIT